MKDLNGDNIFEKLKGKVENGETLKDTEMLSLTFVPLMNSNKSKSTRAVDSIKLASKIKDNENKMQCLSMLYALLDKFGDENIKKSIWEVFSMTDIGKLIREDGIKEGLKDGKVQILIKLLLKKFGKIPDEYKEKIKNLSEESIDIITIDIFDMKTIKDIEKYF